MRKRFATSVNDVMAKIDKTVKFDHRSYEAMGLNVDPMKSVYRITHDRMNDGKLVIQDVEWTRRMVAVKMREAAVKRDPDMIRLQQTARELEGLKKAWPNVGSMNRLLGVNSKIVTIGTMTRKTFVQMVNHRLALETARLEQKGRLEGRAGTLPRGDGGDPPAETEGAQAPGPPARRSSRKSCASSSRQRKRSTTRSAPG